MANSESPRARRMAMVASLRIVPDIDEPPGSVDDGDAAATCVSDRPPFLGRGRFPDRSLAGPSNRRCEGFREPYTALMGGLWMAYRRIVGRSVIVGRSEDPGGG